jgi:molecular chaperone Hsp33
MIVSDKLVRAMFANNQARIIAALTTDLVEAGRDIHGTYPTATAAFGRCLTAAALLGSMTKNDERVILQIIGDGPIGRIIAESSPELLVRGFIQNPAVHLPLNKKGKLAVGPAVGKGHLYITRQTGLKTPYQGSVALVSGEIAEDLACYFSSSEQIPSVVALGVLVNPDGSVKAAGGLILQLLPGASDEIIDCLESRMSNMPPISRLIENGKTPEAIIHLLANDLQPRIISEQPVEYRCRCSKERFLNALTVVQEKDLQEMITEDQGAELVCHFCGNRYHITESELTDLLAEKGKEHDL